jgi:hypothetical protein
MINFNGSKPFGCSSFDDRFNTYIRFVLDHAKIDGMWLEFGVATGATTEKYVTVIPEKNKPLYGFDSFQGLPEKWMNHNLGSFSTGGKVPEIRGAEMIVGLFNETLPKFIEDHQEEISVLIVDCDLYSSTKTIFDNCKSKIVPGTVIIFDEIHNGDGINHDWENHEYKAFMEFVEEMNVEFRWIAHVPNGEQASCIVTKIRNSS